MPELAEVEFYRNEWSAGLNQPVLKVYLHAKKRIFRGTSTDLLARSLPKTIYKNSVCSGKWMLFNFKPSSWLGVHLGMTGSLSVGSPLYQPLKHDHLVLYQKKQCLIFTDPRLFGRINFERNTKVPLWWQALAPSILSTEFTKKGMNEFLKKRARSPIKAVLLMQERFPGIGNWMADEILWRAKINPRRTSMSLDESELECLWKQLRHVCRDALRVIGTDWSEPPNSWLFNHRWKAGGLCPLTGCKLVRETIGGRTTCWSPKHQK